VQAIKAGIKEQRDETRIFLLVGLFWPKKAVFAIVQGRVVMGNVEGAKVGAHRILVQNQLPSQKTTKSRNASRSLEGDYSRRCGAKQLLSL
jgi:hypothetical protein